MNPIINEIHVAIHRLFPGAPAIESQRVLRSLEGNQSLILRLSNAVLLYVKQVPAPQYPRLKAEAEGLGALKETGILRVPAPLAHGTDGRRGFLITEYIRQGKRKREFWEDFGKNLALLHRIRQNSTFGYAHDNYLGEFPQINRFRESWTDFFVQNRLFVQLRLAFKRGYLDRQWIPKEDLMEERVRDRLGGPEAPSLIHGDLGSRNLLSAESGEAVLINPAVCFGHPELDLARCELSRDFSPIFYEAYHQILPGDPQYQERKELYWLYYLLLDLNRYGSRFIRPVVHILNQLA